MISRLVVLALVLLGLAACDTTEPAPDTLTLWGNAQIISRTETVNAPATLRHNNQTWLAFSGADDIEPRHYAATDTRPPTILALKAYYPRDYQLWPAAGGRAHLLWLDRTADSTRISLQSATITPSLVAEIGPTRISQDTGAFHFSALGRSEGAVRAVWSGDDALIPALYTARIDGQGRATFPVRLRSEADFPALVGLSESDMWLYWVERGAVWGALLADDTLIEPRRVADLPQLALGDRIDGLEAAQDATHHAVFVQIIRADGTPQVWWTAARPQGDWRPVEPFGFVLGMRDIQTGFNSGTVSAAAGGDRVQQWASPLREPANVVPVAVSDTDGIGVLYIQGGGIIGYQRLRDTVPLLGAPAISADTDGHLYVTWAQPIAGNPSPVLLISTRQPVTATR